MRFRLLSYSTDSSLAPRAGLCVAQQVYDLQQLTGMSACSSVLSALEQWQDVLPAIEKAVRQLESGVALGVESRALDKVRLHTPILYPGAVYGAGANYDDHVQEMGRVAGRPPAPNLKQVGERPWHFLKSPRGTVVGPDAIVAMPPDAQEVDWEIELAVVMGRRARHISKDEALAYVAGYTISNDLSARDLFKRSKTPTTSPFYFDWIAHKSFEGSCPLGPWIVPASEIADPMSLSMKLWVGDELMQDASTSNMIFDVAEQIEALSARVTLYPGDVILTGTPAGVGSARKRFLRSGEKIRLWIEGIGEMSHGVV